MHKVSFAETEVLTPETPEERLEDVTEDTPIRPYERRAINFLVNEYLLTQDYKLSSVTFAEENENQVRIQRILYSVCLGQRRRELCLCVFPK